MTRRGRLFRILYQEGNPVKRLIQQVERFWCVTMHSAVMWPYRGRYHCRTCFREYPVQF